MKARKIMIFLWGIAALAAFSGVILLLWNLLMPTIFGLTTINFWQALGLLVLSRILFGGFGGMHKHFGHKKNPIHDKWMRMTPEQREEFINKRRKFGFNGPFHGHDYFNSDSTTDKDGQTN